MRAARWSHVTAPSEWQATTSPSGAEAGDLVAQRFEPGLERRLVGIGQVEVRHVDASLEQALPEPGLPVVGARASEAMDDENGLVHREGLWPLRAKARGMEIKAKRTLVKSAPELWELADDLARLEAWMGGFVGSEDPGGGRGDRAGARALSRLAKLRRAQGGAEIQVALAESGFGTSVEISARHGGGSPAASAALERLLDELGSPDRRPFSAG